MCTQRKIYRARAVVPAVWLKHQPRMSRAVRADYSFGSLQVQWRWPEFVEERRWPWRKATREG